MGISIDETVIILYITSSCSNMNSDGKDCERL